jgi:hypothetical protein
MSLSAKDMCTIAVRIHDYMCKYPNLRRGQNYFNAFDSLHHDLADQIRGTDIDPFYNDKKIAPFLQWIGAQLR